MITEAAVTMMILAVDVGRDRAADTDEFGTRHDFQEEAARHVGREDVGNGDAGLDRQLAARRIEAAHPVEAR